MKEQFDDEFMFDELGYLVEDQSTLGFDDEPVLNEADSRSLKLDAPDQSAAERLADLLDHMKAYQRQLLTIIEYCKDPRELEDISARISEMQKHAASVFAPESLCGLLERAGGLVRLDAEGNLFDPAQIEPQEVAVDGAIYYEIPEENPRSFYQSTSDALALLEQDDRAEHIDALLEERRDFLFVVQTILELASAEGGTQIKDIENSVLPDARFTGSKWRPNSFLNKLEEADAVAWDGSWKTTEYGRELLASIASGNREAAGIAAARDLQEGCHD